jgi:type IV pilus secretin PilQ/predicted competence protein
MKRKICFGLIFALCLFTLSKVSTQSQEALVNINKIYVQTGELKVKIVLETDAPLPLLKTYYSKESPQTIVTEWDKIKAIKEPSFSPEESPLIQSLNVERMNENQLRFLLNLKEQVPYRVLSDKKSTTIELIKIQRSLGKYPIDAETEKSLQEKGKVKTKLNKVDFSEKEDKIDVIIKTSNNPVPNVFAMANPLRLVVDLLETSYGPPTSSYTVNKMGVKSVRVGQFQVANPMISRLVFDLTHPKFYEMKYEKSDLVISFFKDAYPEAAPEINALPLEEAIAEIEAAKPKEEEAKKEEVPPTKKEPVAEEVTAKPAPQVLPADQFKPKTIVEVEEKYMGEIVSLKMKDADLRDVVTYLGEFAGLNVIFDPEVSGRVTCDLVDVPWDQALDIILKVNRMGRALEGNVLRIASMGALAREQEQRRQLERSREMAGPIEVKTVTLSYSKARDVQSLLTPKLSQRGNIIIDERTNTLIISDVRERLDLVESLLTVVDTPTPQVSIEARIVEATAKFARQLGVQWGFRGIMDPFYGNQTSLRFPHDVTVDGAIIPKGTVTKGIGGPLGGYAINLPAPAFNSALGLTMGNVLDTFRLDMALTALESSGKGQIISCPKVTTQNNMQAEIIQGRQIPIQTVANFTVTTRFQNAALELRATPQITAEGTIIMTIEIRNNAPDFANLVNGIPPITTQSARTTVMVHDGGTTVIGGIYRTEDSLTRERVPFLHKIPILGALFKNSSRTTDNRELLIFITPRIIKF